MCIGISLGFVFDLDGTVYLSDQLIAGSDRTIAWVRQLGASIRFVTNNPRFSRNDYAQKLKRLGIPVEPEHIITSADLLVEYLQSHPEYGTLYVIGEEFLKGELLRAGLQLTERSDANTVIVSFDTTLSYQKLLTGYRALINGAHFLATNPDVVCPTTDGGLLDAGAIIAALAAATGRHVETVVGKPSAILGTYLAEQMQVQPSRCFVIGDRLQTDVRLGRQSGMKTVWICPNPGHIKLSADMKPDFIVKSISDLPLVLSHTIKIMTNNF